MGTLPTLTTSLGQSVGTLPTLTTSLGQSVEKTSYMVEPTYQKMDKVLNRILTLCAGRAYPTDAGSMFSTYEQVYTYILKKMAHKVHLH